MITKQSTNSEKLQAIEELLVSVKSVLDFQVCHNEAQDVPEYIASELIDIIEWMSPYPELSPMIAKKFLEVNDYSGISKEIKKYFNLAY